MSITKTVILSPIKGKVTKADVKQINRFKFASSSEKNNEIYMFFDTDESVLNHIEFLDNRLSKEHDVTIIDYSQFLDYEKMSDKPKMASVATDEQKENKITIQGKNSTIQTF